MYVGVDVTDQALDFTYNAAGKKLSQITIPGAAYGYIYSATTGQLSSIGVSNGPTLSYGYDGFLLQSESATGDISGSVAYDYDTDFRLMTLSVNGSAISLNYDNDSLLTGAGAETLTRNTQNGLLTGTALNTVTTAQTYNAFAELVGDTASTSGNALYSASYTRDQLGRITAKTETIQGTSTSLAYGYDSAGRLQTVSRNGGLIASYGYDANGNRLSRNGSTASYDAQDRLLSDGNSTYAYTANGELQTKTQSGATIRYDYDLLGNLRKATLPDGTVIDYVIDGRNRRVGKKLNGTLTQGFLYQDQLEPAAELDGSNSVVSRFVYASKRNVPDYLVKGGITYRIISDHLGSPRLIVNTSDGTIVQRMDYDEFGNVTGDTNPGFQPFGFAGGLYDGDTKLTRFGARDYDAETGRWAAKDPILFAGGDTDLYAYVGENPVSYTDPSGKLITEVIG